ncbi:type II toxin-antitoxin system RelE/ParE family toxin [Sphingomonas adhaesiva]|uniref:type II toxin-antitoxin system RelE/ParE family toxin n=1 Tax=Sphingomonas adhaesiva TaxID=28212 RepID=UPI002FF859DE
MRTIWSLRAQDDIFDIAEHYDRIDPHLADEIVRRLEEAVAPLQGFARLGAAVEGLGAVRKWRVPTTPYVLLYVALDDMVEIRRVVHAASDWKP